MGLADIELRMERWMKENGICCPWKIDLDWIAEQFDLVVYRIPRASAQFKLKLIDCRFVTLDSTHDQRQQRVELAHEIAHAILHCGNQLNLPDMMRASQECQARRLAHHILAPDYLLIPRLREALLDSSDAIGYLAEEFRVPIDEMEDRLVLLRTEHPSLQVAVTDELEWGC